MTFAYFKHLLWTMIEKKITVGYLQLLIPTHFINYSEFREAGYLISFSNAKKITFCHHANTRNSCSVNIFDRNPVDSKMSSKAKNLMK